MPGRALAVQPRRTTLSSNITAEEVAGSVVALSGIEPFIQAVRPQRLNAVKRAKREKLHSFGVQSVKITLFAIRFVTLVWLKSQHCSPDVQICSTRPPADPLGRKRCTRIGRGTVAFDMTYKHKIVRPGLTAIAAVFALSSTSLLAQTADPATASPSPIAADPAPISAAPTSVAPVITAPAPIAADPLAATTPTTTTKPTPRKVVTRTVATTTMRTVSKAAPVAARTTARTASPIAAKAAAPAPVPVPIVPAQSALPVTGMTSTPIAPTNSAPVAETTTTTAPTDQTLPIVGAGAAALALAGAGFALSRRRRRRDEEQFADGSYVPADEPVAEPIMAEQVIAPEPRFTPAPAMVATTTLPAAFDASDRSPRIEAAYAGPSEDNPSLSLRKRLKRATALDQMERNGHFIPPSTKTARSETPKPNVSTWANPAPGGLMFGRDDPALRPAFTAN
jgi:hypothetical protein